MSSPAPEAPTPTINSQPGLSNLIIHGDCQQIMRTLPDASVDLVLTDPPYIVRYRDKNGRKIENDDNGRWVYPAFAEMYRVLKPGSYCISFYGWPKIDRFFAAWRQIGFYPVGHFVWVKRYASNAGFVRMRHEQAYLLAKGNPKKPVSPPSDVLDYSYTGNHLHPTQKPVSGLVPLIRAFSNPGAVVLDPFAGSGSTGAAAQYCRRKYILIEKDACYYKAARGRLTAFGLAKTS